MTKISQLPAATTPLAGTELVPIVQGGTTKSVAASAFGGGGAGFDFGTGYNVLDYGLTGDGVTDDRNALNTLLNTTAPTGSVIYFPPGTYYIGSSIIINSGKKFRFISDQAKITSGNYIVFNISSSYDWFIQGIEFICTTYGGQASAISIAAGTGGGGGFRISDCKFNSYAIAVQASGTQGNLELRGGVIMNCRFISNDYAIYCENYGEYIEVIGNTIMGCPNVGVWLKGGNFLVANNLIVQNGRGIQVVNGNNNGHGVIIGNEINHSTTYSLDIQDTILGVSITGNNIFDGPILIANTTYVAICGGQIQTQTITSTNNTNLFFSNIMFMSGYAPNSFSSTGTVPKFFACFGDVPSGATNVFSF